MSTLVAGGTYFLAAIVSILTAITGKQLSLNETGKGTEIKDATGKVIATIPKTQTEAFTFTQIFFKRISNITALEKADDVKPDVTYKSLDTAVKLSNFAIVPDAAFQLHGMVEIHINKTVLLPATSAADFTDLNAFTLPIPIEGVKLRRGEQLDIFLWTDDGTASAITITAAVSKQVEIGQH